MEFLNRMKKREYIEMGLKTAIGVLLGIIVIFLMEAMITSIYMKSIDNREGSYPSTAESSVYYVIENSDNTYDIYLNYEPNGADVWVLHYDNCSQEKYEALWETDGELYRSNHSEKGGVIFREPNCFDIFINWAHYLVMVIFIMAIGGVYAWRFTLISKEYKKLAKKLNKTGKVFI